MLPIALATGIRPCTGAILVLLLTLSQGIVEIGVLAPAVTVETPVFVQLELVDGDAPLGVISLAATVVPDGTQDQSADAGDANDDGIETTGGCSAGGGAGGLALLVPALLVLRRRRR